MDREKKLDVCVLTIVLMVYTLNRFSDIRYLFSEPIVYLLKNHFNDYLGGVAFAAYTNILLANKGIRMSGAWPLLVLGIICSACWEGIAPLFLSYSTGDWIDCGAYILGTSTYWIVNKMFAVYSAA